MKIGSERHSLQPLLKGEEILFEICNVFKADQRRLKPAATGDSFLNWKFEDSSRGHPTMYKSECSILICQVLCKKA
jgi:hypothetical protein